MSPEALEAWLKAQIAQATGLTAAQIDSTRPFREFGLESVDAVGISGDLEASLSRPLEPTLLYEHPTIEALVDHLVGRSSGVAHARLDKAAAPDPIAIVGIGCRLPGAKGPRALWQSLMRGADAISPVPSARWDAGAFFDPDPLAPGKMGARWGGFIDDVDGFDHAFFKTSFQEAAAMDPQQRALLEVAWEALADANIRPSSLARADVGVFIGIAHNDYEALQLRRPDTVTGQSGLGSALSIAANRISYKLDLRGPSIAVDTACSSSLVATHLALQSLRRGECSMALVGGANVILSPEVTIAFSKAGMMAADGRCKSFCRAADGYVRSEGVGVVVLAPLSRAREANWPIYALIVGSAVNQDGLTNGLSAPRGEAQEAVLRAAQIDAGVAPECIAYVEAHGTGTRLGDPIEARALGRAVRPNGSSAPPCLIGSIKSNIGHLEAAAGIAGLIKAAQVVHHGVAPPNLHFAEPNPDIDFDGLQLRVPVVPEALPVGAHVGVSGFGFGGTNCHLLLAPAPGVESFNIDRGRELVVLSARTPAALDGARRDLAAAIRDLEPGITLYDVAATLALGRDHEPCRLAIACSDLDDLARQLETYAPPPHAQRLGLGAAPPRIAFVYPGQGAQYPGMPLDLGAAFPGYAASLRRSDEIAAEWLGGSLAVEIAKNPQSSRLAETRIAQPALVALQIAMTDLLAAIGVRPDTVIGHSLGEIAAGYASGVLDAPGALRLACERGRAMDRPEARGAMLAVRAGAESLAERGLGQEVAIAAENGPRDTVLAGPRAALERIAQSLSGDDIAHRWVPTQYAFHTPRLVEASEHLRHALTWMRPAAPRLTFYSTVTGERRGADFDASYWAAGIPSPVRFARAAQALADDGVDIVIEISPRPTLVPALGWLKTAGGTAPARLAISDGLSPTLAVLQTLGELHGLGCPIDWRALFPLRPRAVRLPHYHWEHTDQLLNHRLAARDDRVGSRSVAPPDGLLGQEEVSVVDSPVRVWRSEISLERFAWLADHRVANAIVLPAAAMIDMMTSAARRAMGRPGQLQDLTISHAVPLGHGAAASLVTKVEATSSVHAVELLAKIPGDPAWRTCARASIVRDEPAAEPAGSIAGVVGADPEPRSAAAFYANLEANGLSYGPAFRKVSRVWRLGSMAAAELVALDGEEVVRRRVTDIDAAFQAIAAASPETLGDAGPWAPVGARLLRWGVEAPPRFAHIDLTSSATDEATATVTLLSADEDVVFEVRDLRLRRLAGRQVDSTQAGQLWFYGDVWEPLEASAPTSDAQRWLVLGQVDDRTDALAEAFAAAGQTVVRLTELDGEPDLWRETVRRHVAPTERPFDGVACLWGLDQPEGVPGGQALVSVALDRIRILLRELAFANGAPRLWLMTEGAQAAGPDQATVNAWQTPIWGLGFAAAFELPDQRCARLDLDPSPRDRAAQMTEVAALMCADPADGQFVERGSRTFARRIAALPPPDCPAVKLAPTGSYLITGGFGALGLAVAQRFVEDGAGHVVLLGRRQPNERAARAIDRLSQRDCVVTTVVADVADRHAVERVLAQVDASGRPLRGIVHAAGVLNDSALANLTQSQLDDALRPKVLGGWALHQLTETHALDFFVMFSSGAAALGSTGQAAYMAANAFLQGLAEKRSNLGLPAICIDWGPWGETGMAADAIAEGKSRSLAGLAMIEPASGLESLMQLIGTPLTRVVVMPGDLRGMLHLYPARAGLSLFRNLIDPKSQVASSLSGAVARRPEISVPFVAPRGKLEATIAGIWQRALGYDNVGVLDPFFELGGDSVFANQILAQIDNTFGVTLDPEQSFAAFTVAHLSAMTESALLLNIESMTEDEVTRALRVEGTFQDLEAP
jgi:acyl transferase domain-containing protein/NAD(P)-dependent dehydrogenase (short-subunit alcohol dehydrogenase family)/acyl carrier protein